MATGSWIDISMPLCSEHPNWAPSPPCLVRRVLEVERHDPYNVSVIWIGSHSGTHVDAPRHVLARGSSVDQMPIEAGMGPARVVHIRGKRAIDAVDLAPFELRRGERFLVRTDRSDRDGGIDDRPIVHLTEDAARHIASNGVRLFGVDALHADDPNDVDVRASRILLAAGVWLLVGIDLSNVPAGGYELACLPILLPDGDAAPARAVVKPL